MEAQKKSKIPYIFFAFFAVIFAVDGFFIYLSQKTWRGVVTEDAYQKGIDYNLVLDEERRQEELGWKMTVYFENKGQKNGDLVINFQDKDLKLITDAEIFIEFKRPTQSGHDFSQKIEFTDGSYKTNVQFPLKGQWDFMIRAKRDDDMFQKTKRFILQ